MNKPQIKHISGCLRGDRKTQLACVDGKSYQTTILDCQTGYTYPPDEISRAEAQALVLNAGPKSLHYQVILEDLVNLGFDEKKASEWISILDAGWIQVSLDEPSKNPRLPYMVTI